MALIPRNINTIRYRIKRRSARSLREMAKTMSIGRESARKIAVSSLNLRAYKMKRGQWLDERMMRNRLLLAKKINGERQWREAHFGERQWTFVNDWAPAHKAISTKKLCKEAFPDFWDADIWPRVSPDLNAMDYGVWAILERKACAINHKLVDALKRVLLKAWDEITPEMCATIIDSFPKRINACIASEGGHFEHLLE